MTWITFLAFARSLSYFEGGQKSGLARIIHIWENLLEQRVFVENNKIVFNSKEDKARSLTYGIIKSMFDFDSEFNSPDQIFIVWSCKTLQNWKMILSAPFKDAPLVEVTYNGDKKETYIDVYRKLENVCIPD